MKNINFKYNNALIKDEEIIKTASILKEYVVYLNTVAEKNNYDFLESSINLAFDNELINDVKRLVLEKSSDELKYIFVVGIGGSNLGTMAIYEAIYGQNDQLISRKHPKIIFVDTVSVKLLKSIKEIIQNNINNPKEFILNIISKSGGTTETVVDFEVVYKMLVGKFGNIDESVVVTTDYKSKLYGLAVEKGFSVLTLPEKVGGRYSVFSAVGLFSLSLCGIDIDELLQGVKIARNYCLSKDVLSNPAIISAILIYLHNKKGINILNNFFFNPELESMGRWYRQLIGESVGKEHGLNKEVVHSGITPIVSIGSADLHSMAQLYLGGPKDKFTNFVYADQDVGIFIPNSLEFLGLVDNISGREVGDIMKAILGGVITAYKKKQLPFMEVFLPDISAGSIGQYLQFKMTEMMFLAQLLGVNAFDQPNVEDYKVETKRLLQDQN